VCSRYILWMHIELPAKSTLINLDNFIRDVWVECCGHLSHFFIAGQRYTNTVQLDWEWGLEGKSTRARLGSILQNDMDFTYEYDFGTTTEIKLKVMDTFEGFAIKRVKINIMARNYLPDFRCAKCNQPASQVYTFEYPYLLLCQEHAASDPEYAEGCLPIVNSPRLGECGYIGPENKKYLFNDIYQQATRSSS
jgi:hypothetical protein